MKSHVEIIRGMREDKDLKQIDIANVIGTTQQHYSTYETGGTELPLRALIALADFYGVSTDYLLGRTQCREGVNGLDKPVTKDCSIGKLLSDVLALNSHAKEAVVEYVKLHTIKRKWDRLQEKSEGGPK